MRADVLEVAVAAAQDVFLQVVTEFRIQVERTAHLIRVALATLGGMIAAIGLVLNAPIGVTVPAAALLAAAVLCRIVSVAVLVSNLVDPRRRRWIALGPDPAGIQRFVANAPATCAAFLESHLQAIAASAHRTQKTIARTVRSQSLGLSLLTLGVALLLLGLGYIVGGVIHG